MLGSRVLVIKNLVVAPPDELVSKYDRGDLTIDDILEWLLEYRKTSAAVTQNNRAGNFEYFSCDCPYGCNPEDPKEFNEQTLLNYLATTGPEKKVAGMMTSLIYDDDLQSYRNCYLGDEEKDFEEKKKAWIAERDEMLSHIHDRIVEDDKEVSDEPSCDHCDNICSEHCPDEPGVGQDDE